MSFRKKNDEVGYAHWVVGVDNSSPEKIAAYVYSLLESQPKSSWYSSGHYQIVRAVFRSFNAFTGKDLEFEMPVEGSTNNSNKAKVIMVNIDDDSQHTAVEPVDWKGVFVCSGLRLLALPACYIPCMNARSDHITAQDEKFLSWAGEMLGNGTYLVREIPSELDKGDPRDIEPIQRLLYRYLNSNGRSRDIVKLFSQMLFNRPVAAIPLAYTYREMGNTKDSMSMLLRALRKDPLCVDLLLAQIKILLEINKPHLALPLARIATEQEPLSPDTWLALAKVYLALEEAELVLLALNGLPSRVFSGKNPLRPPEAALEDLVTLPNKIPAKSITEPPGRPAFVLEHEWRYFDTESEYSELFPELKPGVKQQQQQQKNIYKKKKTKGNF